MLSSYKKISIIYGGEGRSYASKIKEELERLHHEEKYPLFVNDLNTEWVGHDILGDVVKAIKNSDLIFIVFTLDDIGASKKNFEKDGNNALRGRLRQNVLIELGMALVVVGEHKEKIMVVSDFNKTELGDDFPSDIRNSLEMRQFRKDNFEEILGSLIDHVRHKFGIEPTTNILHEEDAIEDFENVFDEFDKLNLYSDKKIKNLSEILSMWLPALKEFTFPEERLLYCLERIKSLPIFGNGEKLCNWIREFERDSLISVDRHHPDYEYISFVQDVASACLEYTIVKSDDSTEDDFEQYSSLVRDFSKLEKRYEEFVSRGVKIRPLIGFMLTEYYGLSLMRLMKINSAFEHVDKALEEFEKCYEYAKRIDTRLELYQGYASFNIGRCHYYKFLSTKDEKEIDLFLDYMDETIKIRKRWKELSGFMQCYMNALSFEYFYAQSEYNYMKKNINKITNDEYKANLSRIISEIDGYICKDSELQKLYKLKQRCVKLNS